MFLQRPLLAALARSLVGPALVERARRARRRLASAPRSGGPI
jgi:hypothetical protein